MKNSIKKALSVLAIGAVAVSATSVSAFAVDGDGGYDAEVIAASEKQPVTTVTKTILPVTEAGKEVVVNIEVDNNAGAAGDIAKGYASSGIHLFYDSRLTLVETDEYGDVDDVFFGVTRGKATAKLGTLKVKKDTSNKPDSKREWSGIFMATASDTDAGTTGLMYSMKFQVPANAQAGDVYPLDVCYIQSANAEDLFIDKNKTDAGFIMQAYFFTQGIYSPAKNYVSPDSEPDNVKAVMNGSTYDGYIAIEGAATTTSTTTTTTSTTTATSTATSTAATTSAASATAATTSAAPATAATTSAAPATGATTGATAASTSAVSTSGATGSSTKASTKAGATTKAGAATTAKPTDSPKTGVAGAGAAIAGLAVAVGAAFVLRKRED